MFNAGLADDFGTDYVLDGELVVVEGDGKLMDRKKGNGLINKAIHGTLPYEVAKRVHFIIFDIIPIADWNAGYCATPYEDRLRLLVDKCSNKRYNFSIVNTKIVNNEREAYKHFTELYEGGEEGTILKDKKNVWEGKRSKTQIKYKGVITCDLQVVGYLEGTGKYAGKIGSLECVSSDGLVEVSVGSGLSDKDRDIPFSEWKGSIVEVAYNERIKAKTNDAKWSLYLPRFLGRRFDKDEADSIDNIPFKRVKK
jgi:ATP-dependent DNA ligase